MNTVNDTPPILPDRFKQPLFLLWLWVIPQLLLLFLNGRAGWLAIGEMTAPQKIQAGWIGAGEVGLLLLGLATTLWLHLRKRPAGYVLCTLGLLLHSGYLWLFFVRFSEVWPAAVAPWMLPETEIVYYQFALIMPALFYFGFRLACFEAPVRRSTDTALSLAAFVLVPLAWFLLFQLIRLVCRNWSPHRFPETLAIVFFTVSTVFVLMAFLRLLLLIYNWLQEKAWSRLAVPLAAGLLAPLGGLILNRYIPFPCDFQSTGVYVLTVINGLVLLIPSPPLSAGGATALWLLRSALYPFSLYFFVVFLPFMPLSLLAMLACGAGFLILAPTLLFVIHTQTLLAEGAAVAARWGRTLTITAFSLCLLLIPLGFTLRAVADRTALHRAMTVAFSPDYASGRTGLNRPATQRALAHLRDMKDGIYLPFLSDYYNALVFNGMVLPDDKMQTLHRMFFGADAPKPGKGGEWSLLMAPRARSRGWRGARTTPSRTIQFQDLTVEENQTNDLVRASLLLTLKNQGPADSEFVTDIVLPDGVLVSGYWLDVAGQRKPGRIVEKKTAQWVYHMIRDFTRRDPGLLLFKTETQLTLNVYPFGAGETRTTGFDLLFPRGLHPRVRIGERDVNLGAIPDETASGPLAASQPEGRVQVILSGAALRTLPTVTREPYLHFIVDRSAGATNAASDLAAELASLAATLGGASSACRITFANYEWEDITPALVPLTALRDTVSRAGDLLPCRGGFCYDRVIAHALLQAQQEGGGRAPGDALRVPLFVVVMAKGTVPLSTVDLAAFQRLVPDLPFYYLQNGHDTSRVSFTGDSTRLPATNGAPHPVVLFQSEGRFAACLTDSDVSLVSLPGSTESLQVFDPATRGFVPLPGVRILEDSVYTRGLALWDSYRETVWAPDILDARLKELVADSRLTGIIIPLTSYMVVENTAQEKTLAQKEKQSLGTHHALEFEENQPTQAMPEPGTVWLLPVSLLLLFWHARRQRKPAFR